jgi:hypothetical protein
VETGPINCLVYNWNGPFAWKTFCPKPKNVLCKKYTVLTHKASETRVARFFSVQRIKMGIIYQMTIE